MRQLHSGQYTQVELTRRSGVKDGDFEHKKEEAFPGKGNRGWAAGELARLCRGLNRSKRRRRFKTSGAVPHQKIEVRVSLRVDVFPAVDTLQGKLVFRAPPASRCLAGQSHARLGAPRWKPEDASDDVVMVRSDGLNLVLSSVVTAQVRSDVVSVRGVSV